jgi:starch phosphorylase
MNSVKSLITPGVQKALPEILHPFDTPSEGNETLPYTKYLLSEHLTENGTASARDSYEALARAIRDKLAPAWVQTEATYRNHRAKRVYYLSMEYLIGRSLTKNVTNMGIEPLVQQTCREAGLDWEEIVAQEAEPGLGNGGLGRLAACLLDSMATQHIPAMGYGMRYEYGIFKQTLWQGWQREQPDHWLQRTDPWEVARPGQAVEVHLACSVELHGGTFRIIPGKPSVILGIPYDRPVVGYGGKTVNTLRLWRAAALDTFDFHQFSSGDFAKAISGTLAAETVTRVLYPDDSTTRGRGLRFIQEFFLVACSIADLVRRFREGHDDWASLADQAAVQLNDTHPALAVPELMRVLLDEAHLEWDEAWAITQRVLAYTNHTLLPEAMEKWPLRFFKVIIPRHLELIKEINRRLLTQLQEQYPGDEARCRRMALIERRGSRRVRMAHLAMLGCHSVNGVSELHSQLLRDRVVSDFAELYPDRFNNKTNGINPRRWLLQANPALAQVITEAIGDAWITDLHQLEQLRPLAEDASFQTAFRQAKSEAKTRLADWLKNETGQSVNPDTIFDSQIKRIHEYKRQLLNALHIVILYNRLRTQSHPDMPARTFFFAGKAAPAYRLAKLVIKLINNIGAVIAQEPRAREKLQLVFVPNYNVTVAEYVIAASDVSEQISTAGYEASGTGNMKFMLNGALTVGTRDGATIEMAEAVGQENIFLFGLTADQVNKSRDWYDPHWHIEREAETRAALELVFSDHFCAGEPGIFEPLRQALLEHGDYYMHVADLMPYAWAQQQVGELYQNAEQWTRKAILNVASSGFFSSDRTVKEYAEQIWNVTPLHVEEPGQPNEHLKSAI